MSEQDRAVLFADLAGFTALTEAHGDERAVDAVVRFVDLAKVAMSEGARLVKTIGDAVMVLAPDCRAGVETALALLADRRRRTGVPWCPHRPARRNGGGEGRGRVRGHGQHRGAPHRACPRRSADHDRASHGARDEHTEAPVRSLGPTRLKNVGEEIELFAVEGPHERPAAQVLDPVCRMYIDADAAPAKLPWGDRTWTFCSFECASAFAADPRGTRAREHRENVRPRGCRRVRPPQESTYCTTMVPFIPSARCPLTLHQKR